MLGFQSIFGWLTHGETTVWSSWKYYKGRCQERLCNLEIKAFFSNIDFAVTESALLTRLIPLKYRPIAITHPCHGNCSLISDRKKLSYARTYLVNCLFKEGDYHLKG